MLSLSKCPGKAFILGLAVFVFIRINSEMLMMKSFMSLQEMYVGSSSSHSDVNVHVTPQTHWNASDRLSTPGIYMCSSSDGDGRGEMKKVLTSALPEYEIRDLSYLGNKLISRHEPKYLIPNYTNEYDVFIACFGFLGCSQMVSDWVNFNFNGHFVSFSGETEWVHPVGGLRVDRSRYHMFASPPDLQLRSTDVILTYMQMVWWHQFTEIFPPKAMVDPSERPRGRIEDGHTRPSNFMIYGQGNCVSFREIAVGLMSEFGVVHCDGRCQGKTPPSGNRTNLVKTSYNKGIGNWNKNVHLYAQYRFCVVLEHAIGHPTYITEKILMAFIGGCIPIYQGPDLIFDIFNRKAFVFYNVSNPQPSLDQIQLLENDETVYNAMMNEPIAANGNVTIEKYFSFNDTIGGGSMKRRFREKLGVTNLVP